MMASGVSATGPVRVLGTEELFDCSAYFTASGLAWAGHDVSADGERFLMITQYKSKRQRITRHENFFAELDEAYISN